MHIDTLLKSLNGQIIYYKPNPGNGGDALIANATYTLFKKYGVKYHIIQGDEDLSGKVIVYGGGGNLVREYNDCANFLNSIKDKAKKIILLPHTISGHADLLSTLDGNVTIICREQVSFDYVKSFDNIKCVLLMDDLVLNLNLLNSLPLLKSPDRLIRLVKPRHIISNFYRNNNTLSFYTKKRNRKTILNSFREDLEKTSIYIPQDNIDVSAVINFDSTMTNERLVEKTVINLVSFLNQFSIINTNRLHICIAGALLGKQVSFYENSYWKNRSVFKYSLQKRFPNIKWMEKELK